MPKQVTDEELLTALLTHGGAGRAAKALKITPQAVYKRLQDDGLRSAYNASQGALLALGAGELLRSIDDAVSALRYIVIDPGTPPGTKVAAADAILRHCARYVELASIESRLTALEQQAEGDHEN